MSFSNRVNSSRLEMLKDTPDCLSGNQPSKRSNIPSATPNQRRESYQSLERRVIAYGQDRKAPQEIQGMNRQGNSRTKRQIDDENNPNSRSGELRGVSKSNDYQWRCQICANLNFPSNKSCFSCEAPKPIHEILRTPVTQLGPPGLFKEGDWQCFNCRNVNFKNRQSCNKCSEPKPTEYEQREQKNNSLQQKILNKPLAGHITDSTREERRIEQYSGKDFSCSEATLNQNRSLNGSIKGAMDQWEKPAPYAAGTKQKLVTEQLSWRDHATRENQGDRSRSRSFLKEKDSSFYDARKPIVSNGPTYSRSRNEQRFEKPQPVNYFR